MQVLIDKDDNAHLSQTWGKNIYYTSDAFSIADPSSMQDKMAKVNYKSLIAQLLEHPTGIWEAMGSIPVRISQYFLCPTLKTNEHIIFIIYSPSFKFTIFIIYYSNF